MNQTTAQALYFIFMWILIAASIILARLFKHIVGFILIFIIAGLITLILWLIFYYGKLCSPKYKCSEFFSKSQKLLEKSDKNK